jgi:lipopolysaccharide/colanic/teichoic acid biosynthesis glycosyltransferase
MIVDLSRVPARPADALWQRGQYLFLKRVLDLTVSLVGLVFLFPLMVFIGLLIRLDSPGPALFAQTRIGRRGRPFGMLKYRTMKRTVSDPAHREFMRAFVRGEIHHMEGGRAVFKPFHSSEVTRLGSFLRRTSLDELPQLINVLRGEMSLVGPRPNVPWEVEAYKEWHKKRLDVLPGITGLAQVNGRSGIEFDTIAAYDIEYVDRRSFVLDLKILWDTALQAFRRQGAG